MTSLAASGSGSPGAVFAAVLNAAVGLAVAKLERKVAEWAGNGAADHADSSAAGQSSEGGDASAGLMSVADAGLDELGEGGTAQKVGAEALKAELHGGNPIAGALKGVWLSGSPVVRAAIVTAAVSGVVLLLLSPVLLLVFLLALLVFAAVHRAHGEKKQTHSEADTHTDTDTDTTESAQPAEA